MSNFKSASAELPSIDFSDLAGAAGGRYNFALARKNLMEAEKAGDDERVRRITKKLDLEERKLAKQEGRKY
jgi:hypothetical protein